MTGIVDSVDLLLREGASARIPSTYGETCLMIASFYGHEDIVHLLLERGHVEVNARAADGSTALFKACGKGHTGVADLLLSRGADHSLRLTTFGETALFVACRSGHLGSVDVLLRYGADVTIPDAQGMTCLMAASMHNHVDLARHLVSQGDINIDRRDADGRTALMHAVRMKRHEIVSLLLEAGLNPGLSDLYRMTAQDYSDDPVITGMLAEHERLWTLRRARRASQTALGRDIVGAVEVRGDVESVRRAVVEHVVKGVLPTDPYLDLLETMEPRR
jgi:ankyrin repeat protein